MLRTPLCELFGIDVPIIQAGMGPWTSAELAAAVCNAGGMGSIGAGTRSPQALAREITCLQEATLQPFAVNHTLSNFNEDAFAVTLQSRPRVISFALGNPRGLVQRVHDIGALAMCQVTTVEQARRVADEGVDVIVAQGGEAGGFGGSIGTLALVPQVVDAVDPVPVVAAGGIADGRGLAAALCLGAQGVNIGTRFLASAESPLGVEWRRALVRAESEDTVKVEELNEFFPVLSGEFGTVPRTLRSTFVRALRDGSADLAADAERLRAQVGTALQEQRLYDLLPFAGQTVGLIRDIVSAAEIVSRMAAEADDTMRRQQRMFAAATAYQFLTET